MYCKYCSNRIDSDTTRCTSCGANIDLNDGGQSFFDDGELYVWQSEGELNAFSAKLPKTEMREPLLGKKEVEDDFEEKLLRRRQSSAQRVPYSRKRSKKKKTVWNYLNLSSSNKLIIFCIASALAIVLLVVSIIAVRNSTNNVSKENDAQNNMQGYTQQTGTPSTGVDSDQQSLPAEASPAENPAVGIITEIKDIKIIDKDEKEVNHPISAYISEDTLFVSIEKILLHEGFNQGVKNRNKPNQIIYTNKSTGKAFEIEMGTNKIWMSQDGNEPVLKLLSRNSFNVGNEIYVPVKSILGLCEYDETKVIWDKDKNILYFCK